MSFTLVDYERPSRLVFRGGGRQVSILATIELARSEDGTQVVMRGEMQPRRGFRLLTPLMRPLIERQYADVVHRFRRVMEEQQTEHA